MMIMFSQQLIGGGVVLGTLAIVDRLGIWALAVGIVLYVLGVVVGQFLVREKGIRR